MANLIKEQKDKYIPLLSHFCVLVNKYYSQVPCLSGPFIPNIMSEYGSCDKKYFYIGQDTCDWYYHLDFDNLIDFYSKNKLDKYIDKNNNWLTPDQIIQQCQNATGSFWTMVIKLHIYLHTGTVVNDTNNLSTDEKELLKTIGWGNLNALEIQKTLENEKVWQSWNNNNQSAYYDIKENSKIFDCIKYILDVFNPEKIFIFNWCDDNKTAEVLCGLEYDSIKEKYIQDTIALFKIKKYNTDIIWCPHPRRIKSLNITIEKMINIIDGVLR